ncbi:transposase, Ptta/En/Spm [Tanacetum coccineum]
MSEDEGLFSHDMDGLLADLFPAAPLEGRVHMGESEIHAGPINSEPMDKNEKKKFDDLLKEAEQKIYMDANQAAAGSTAEAASRSASVGQPSQQAENKKRNFSKSDEPHITGIKSFARLCDKETQKNNGVSPSRGRMYCLTRTYQDGSIVNATAAKVVEAIKTMGEFSTAQETRTDGSPYWIDDDLAKVNGPERGGSRPQRKEEFMILKFLY